MRASLALVLAVGLTACNASDDASYEVLSADATGARFHVGCAPSRIEVGIRQRTPLPEGATGMSLDRLPFASRVTVVDGDGSETLAAQEAAHPVVMWMATGNFQQAEFIGLQEVDLPFAWGLCRDYFVELHYADVPAWAHRGTGFDPYVRKSKRP